MRDELKIFVAFMVFVGLLGVGVLVEKEFKIHCYREAAAMGIEEARHVHELCD